jgi:hypothetical protein
MEFVTEGALMVAKLQGNGCNGTRRPLCEHFLREGNSIDLNIFPTHGI